MTSWCVVKFWDLKFKYVYDYGSTVQNLTCFNNYMPHEFKFWHPSLPYDFLMSVANTIWNCWVQSVSKSVVNFKLTFSTSDTTHLYHPVLVSVSAIVTGT